MPPMKSKYKIVEIVSPKGVCHLTAIRNVKNWAYMMRNEPQAGKFPENASFQMNDEFPRDVKLADVLVNTSGFLLVSERFAEFLKTENLLAHNEVHPVGIDNHRGRREKAKYFIIHQIDDPKCVDEAKTVGHKSKLEPDEYAGMRKLVLDDEKIPRDYTIFRAAEYRDRILVRSDVAEKVEKAGFTGIAFFDLDGYDDYW
jgi:hypothetical protein